MKKILSFSIFWYISDSDFRFRLVSHTCVHIGIALLHQIQNPTWSPRNSQDYTWSLTSPSLLPTVVSFQSDSRYWVFWLVTVVRASAAVDLPLLLFGLYKKDNWGLSHISLPSGWKLLLPSWIPPSEEA